MNTSMVILKLGRVKLSAPKESHDPLCGLQSATFRGPRIRAFSCGIYHYDEGKSTGSTSQREKFLLYHWLASWMWSTAEPQVIAIAA